MMANELPDRIRAQIAKAELPITGALPFLPKLAVNKKGHPIIAKAPVEFGPRREKSDTLILKEEYG